MLKRANKTTTDSSINGILDDFFRETPCFDMWDVNHTFDNGILTIGSEFLFLSHSTIEKLAGENSDIINRCGVKEIRFCGSVEIMITKDVTFNKNVLIFAPNIISFMNDPNLPVITISKLNVYCSYFNIWGGKIKLKNCNVISPYEL